MVGSVKFLMNYYIVPTPGVYGSTMPFDTSNPIFSSYET